MKKINDKSIQDYELALIMKVETSSRIIIMNDNFKIDVSKTGDLQSFLYKTTLSEYEPFDIKFNAKIEAKDSIIEISLCGKTMYANGYGGLLLMSTIEEILKTKEIPREVSQFHAKICTEEECAYVKGCSKQLCNSNDILSTPTTKPTTTTTTTTTKSVTSQT